MKNRLLTALAVAVIATASCSPLTTTMHLQLRAPSSSGIDFGGKTMALAYQAESPADSVFGLNVCSGLARALEEEYFEGEEVIGIYEAPKDSVTLEGMHQLVMDTGADVVFVLSRPELGQLIVGEDVPVTGAPKDSSRAATGVIPSQSRLMVYDSMEKADRIHTFKSSSKLRPIFYHGGGLSRDEVSAGLEKSLDGPCQNLGNTMSKAFVSEWQTESLSFYYYDNFQEEWTDAIYYAWDFKWKEAIDKWISLLTPKNNEKTACAAYNIASAFYALGDYDLALQWLDTADASLPLTLSPGLRKRLEARK